MSLSYLAHSLALPSIPPLTTLALATSTTDLGYCNFLLACVPVSVLSVPSALPALTTEQPE